MTKKQFIEKWNNCKKLHIFEICLNDFISLREPEYALFDLWIDKNTDKFYADNISIDIDYDFSLDDNFEALYTEVCEAIADDPFAYI